MSKGRRLHHLLAAAPALSRALLERRLRGRQPGNRHTQRRARDVVQADLVEELDGVGVAAVLAAYTQADVGTGLPTHLASELHQLPHALTVKLLKGVTGKDAPFDILRKKLGLGVVSGEAEGHLCQLGDRAHQRHHYVRLGDFPLAGGVHGRLEDCSGLHGGDVGMDDAEPAAAQAEHGIRLRQAFHPAPHIAWGDVELSGQLVAQMVQRGALVGQELVQRGVQQADGDRQP
eukprot:scaffold197988_cov41-Prasinocladus_malaysianus.AAC.1